MSKRLVIIVLNCIVFYLAGTLCIFGQEKEVDLKDKKITIKMENQHLAYIFRYLMKNYDIQIGFEQSTLDKDHNDYDFETNLPFLGRESLVSADGHIKGELEAEYIYKVQRHWITVNAENQRLEEVLDVIVKQMENYRWEINDGVVNIIPVKGRDERYKKLLETNIKNFTFEEGGTIEEITTNIMELPELRRFLIENKLNFSGIRSGFNIILNAQYGRKLDVGMNFSNITIRELLNKITKIKSGGWILKKKRISKPEEHIDIDI